LVNVKFQGKDDVRLNVMTSHHLMSGYLHKRGGIQTNWKRR
jgi:hypothetical protein